MQHFEAWILRSVQYVLSPDPSVNQLMRTFVHHDGALGDVLLSLDCLRRLRESAGTLHFAGRPDLGGMLRACGIVEESSDSGAQRYAGLYCGGQEGYLKGFLWQFDRSVVFTVDAGGPVSRALAGTIADAKVVLTVPPSGVRVSASRYRIGQLFPEAVPGREPELTVPSPHRDLALAMLARWGWKGDRPLVMVHPGSGGRSKCWPLERYFSLVGTLLAEEGAFVVIATGPAEDNRFLDRVEAFCKGRERIMHLGDTDLPSLAALLGRCSVYVGNDSGVSHLAAAVGSPTVALFGPTDPLVWGPVGRWVQVISAETLEDIPVEQVAKVVRTAFADAATYRGGTKRSYA